MLMNSGGASVVTGETAPPGATPQVELDKEARRRNELSAMDTAALLNILLPLPQFKLEDKEAMKVYERRSGERRMLRERTSAPDFVTMIMQKEFPSTNPKPEEDEAVAAWNAATRREMTYDEMVKLLKVFEGQKDNDERMTLRKDFACFCWIGPILNLTPASFATFCKTFNETYVKTGDQVVLNELFYNLCSRFIIYDIPEGDGQWTLPGMTDEQEAGEPARKLAILTAAIGAEAVAAGFHDDTPNWPGRTVVIFKGINLGNGRLVRPSVQ